MQKFRWGFIIVNFILVLTLSGCGPQTPLQKLQSNESYEDINRVFWGKEKSSARRLHAKNINYSKCYAQTKFALESNYRKII